MLSVARELMTEPSLLLIDEPTAGLAPNLVAQVYDILATAKSATGAAILLVEQNVERGAAARRPPLSSESRHR